VILTAIDINSAFRTTGGGTGQPVVSRPMQTASPWKSQPSSKGRASSGMGAGALRHDALRIPTELLDYHPKEEAALFALTEQIDIFTAYHAVFLSPRGAGKDGSPQFPAESQPIWHVRLTRCFSPRQQLSHFGPSPTHGVRYRTMRHTPLSLHTVRRFAPISDEHLI
jgi:hypothetical protein